MYIDTSVKKKMAEFKAFVVEAAMRQGFQLIPRNQPVQMKVWFFLKRPASDFTNRRRGMERLKESAMTDSQTVVAIKPDTDNMGKFLLDALTGALYEDDSQVVDLHMFKLRDNDGLCNGKVAIEVCAWKKTVAAIMPSF